MERSKENEANENGANEKDEMWKWQSDVCIATYIFNILFSVLLITYNLSFL